MTARACIIINAKLERAIVNQVYDKAKQFNIIMIYLPIGTQQNGTRYNRLERILNIILGGQFLGDPWQAV